MLNYRVVFQTKLVSVIKVLRLSVMIEAKSLVVSL